MNFSKNLIQLIKEAHLYQYAEISDTRDTTKKRKPLLYFTKNQWIILLISTGITFFLNNGFSENFCGYIISGLSLFVGIIFSFLISLLDKFKNIDFEKFNKDINVKKFEDGVKLKNFFKKISVLSLYSILISIISILLLSISLLTPFLSLELDYISMIKNWEKINNECLLLTLLISLYRVFVLYFLLDFLLITVYLVSSLYDFIIYEYNKVRLKQ